MKSGCVFCDNCYKCPLNWDCEQVLEDQYDYDRDYEPYLPLWDNGHFYKD